MRLSKQFVRFAGVVLVTITGVGATFSASARPPSLDQIELMSSMIGMVREYYAVVEDVHSVAADPDKAAILQLTKLEEIYKEQGDRAEAIDVLRQVVANSKSDVVRNAAAVMLADALKETGRASQAVEVLENVLGPHL